MSQSRLSIIPSRAVSDSELTATHLRVLCAIGSFTGKDQSAYPKQSTIAEVIGVTRETVNRAIKLLKERGYVDVADQYRDDGGQRASLYSVRLDPCDDEVTPPVIAKTPCDPVVTPPVTSTITPPVTHAITPKNDPIERYTDTDVSVLENASTEPKKREVAPKSSARGARIRPNWTPTPKDYAFASSEGMTREEINREADTFRDYWISASGRNAAKLDWEATWRNWIRRNNKRSGPAKAPAGTHTAGKSGGGGLVAAGLRRVSEARGYGEPVSEGRGMGANYVIDREAS